MATRLWYLPVAIAFNNICNIVLVSEGFRVRPAVADQSRYVGVLGESLEIGWTLGVKASRVSRIDIIIHSPGESRRIFYANFSSGIPEVIKEPDAEILFPHGINATFTANSKFKVRIGTVERLLENLRFSIGLHNFPGLLVYLNSGISVDVVNTGEPIFCEQIPEKSYTFVEDEMPILSFKLCGVPEPILTWKFIEEISNKVLPSESTPVNNANGKLESYAYQYSVPLPLMRRESCGKMLLLSTSGGWNYNRNRSDYRFPVYVKFTPNSINGIKFYKNVSSCNTIEWIPHAQIGECTVEYNILYISGSKVIGITTDIKHFDHKICSNDYIDATSIVMWASFKGINGPLSEKSSLKNYLKEDEKILYITIVTAVGAVLTIVGIILFMCCRKKNESNGKPSKNENGHFVSKPAILEKENQNLKFSHSISINTELPENPDSKKSHYLELNAKDTSSNIYETSESIQKTDNEDTNYSKLAYSNGLEYGVLSRNERSMNEETYDELMKQGINTEIYTGLKVTREDKFYYNHQDLNP